MKYRVLNPRNIPDNVPVLTLESGEDSKDLFEGDEFEWPVELTNTEDQGLIERVEDDS